MLFIIPTHFSISIAFNFSVTPWFLAFLRWDILTYYRQKYQYEQGVHITFRWWATDNIKFSCVPSNISFVSSVFWKHRLLKCRNSWITWHFPYLLSYVFFKIRTESKRGKTSGKGERTKCGDSSGKCNCRQWRLPWTECEGHRNLHKEKSGKGGQAYEWFWNAFPCTNDTEYRGNDSDRIYKSYQKVTAPRQRIEANPFH